MVETKKTKRRFITGANVSRHQSDKMLIVTILIILIFGLISLSSASSVISFKKFSDAYSLFKHQLLSVILGIIAFLFFSKYYYQYLKKYAFLFLIVSIILLLLVFIPGLKSSHGVAQSWIIIFNNYSLQPSEFVKLTFLLYLAAWLESREDDLTSVQQGVGPFLIIFGIIALLMLLQPDLGTLLIIALTSLIVYFVGGGSIKHVFLLLITGLIILFILISLTEHQVNRFLCFLNPNYDPKGVCYQINQSLIAVGSGGLFGRGLGESRQKYSYIPEVQSDSIFSVIAEELGFVVSSVLVFCYIFLFYRGFLIAKQAPDQFSRNIAIGIVSWIAIQAVINIGGNINLVPLTGVPLPLISSGGSSVAATLAALGILVNISKYTKIK